MYPSHKPTISRRWQRQRGVSLVGAIFVMVLLAALASYIATVSVFQHSGTALSVQSARALAAASSGLEWGIWYVRNNNSCAGPTNFTIGQFTVTQSSCNATAVTEGVSSYNIFELRYTASSTGRSFGNPDFASRTVRATVVGP